MYLKNNPRVSPVSKRWEGTICASICPKNGEQIYLFRLTNKSSKNTVFARYKSDKSICFLSTEKLRRKSVWCFALERVLFGSSMLRHFNMTHSRFLILTAEFAKFLFLFQTNRKGTAGSGKVTHQSEQKVPKRCQFLVTSSTPRRHRHI